jgi:hypothetical protein
MIFNVERGVFGDEVKNGDLIAVANVVAYLRKEQKDPNIKFHMKPGSVSSVGYIQEFYQFILKNTDFFSETPGEMNLQWKRVNLWDFRDIIGDNVFIKNPLIMQEKKIVVFPVFDAPYNVYRNWPQHVFENIISEYSTKEYEGYEKIICGMEHFRDRCKFPGWEYSSDFMTNIGHIMSTETFIGGDTGTSHFAWSLDRAPKNLIYYNSSRGLLHCLPFHLLSGRGKMVRYWLDCEGTTWQ